MRPDNFDINVIIEYLKGSTQTLYGCISDHYPNMSDDDLTLEDHEQIDNEIFWCDQCDWCYETSEANENPDGGGDLCNDCFSEIEEE